MVNESAGAVLEVQLERALERETSLSKQGSSLSLRGHTQVHQEELCSASLCPTGAALSQVSEDRCVLVRRAMGCCTAALRDWGCHDFPFTPQNHRDPRFLLWTGFYAWSFRAAIASLTSSLKQLEHGHQAPVRPHDRDHHRMEQRLHPRTRPLSDEPLDPGYSHRRPHVSREPFVPGQQQVQGNELPAPGRDHDHVLRREPSPVTKQRQVEGQIPGELALGSTTT